MTTDTTALQERIALAMYSTDHDPTGFGSHQSDYYEHAAAVLPVIAAEVQAAKAEAWVEGYDACDSGIGHSANWFKFTRNPYRATETGDRA